MWQLPPDDSKAASVWIESLEESDIKLELLSGAVRSTKTVGSLITWVDRVSSGPKNAPRAMLGNTERTLLRNCLYPLQEFVGSKNCRINTGMGEINLFGRKIYLIGANNIGALPKVQGPTFLDVYCDEAVTYPFEVFNMLVSRLSLPGSKLWATMNPGGPNAWMKKLFIDRADEVLARVWQFQLDDNSFLSEEYKTWLKSTYTGLWKKRMIGGEWAIAEGAVFSSFDPELHAIKALPKEPMDQMRIGCDYGSINPTCFIKLCRYKNKWIATEEFWHNSRESGQKTNSQYAAALKEFIGPLHPTSIEVDPSAAAFIFECRKAGIRGIHGADNDVSGGLQKIAQAIAAGVLIIGDCPHLLEEMGGYVWDDKAAAAGIDKPIKSDDHAIDALRYIINAIY